MILDDKAIRLELKIKLISSRNKPKDLIDEFGICGGKSIADLVAVYEGLHCFEIKSELDTFSRLEKQILFYDKCFDKVTLVTTSKHIEKAFNTVPVWWGIIEVYFNGKVRFKYHRKTESNSSTLDVVYILNSLWKDELKEVYFSFYKKEPLKSYSKKDLVVEISKKRKNLIYKEFSRVLAGRNQRKSFFINEK